MFVQKYLRWSTFFYKVYINMNEKILNGFKKLINSDVIKKVYPMVDHIDITNIRYVNSSSHPGYMISFDIVVDSPEMTHDNMFDFDFDPYYLVDHYLVNLSSYFGIDIYMTTFSVHNLDGEAIIYNS